MRKIKKLTFRTLTIRGPATIHAAGSGGKKVPRFSTLAYTGGELLLNGWDRPVVIDLAGLEPAKSIIVNANHDTTKPLGHVTDIANDGQKLELGGLISYVSPSVVELLESHENGFPHQASIEARPTELEHVPAGEVVRVNGRNLTGPLTIARKSKLYGVAFLPHGADESTAVSLAAERSHAMDFEQYLTSLGFNPDDLTEEQRAALQKGFNAAADDDDDESKVKAGRRHHAGEFKAIYAAVDRVLPDIVSEGIKGQIVALRDKAMAGSITIADFQEGLFDAYRRDREKVAMLAGAPAGPVIRASTRDIAGPAMEAALLISAGLSEKWVGREYGEQATNVAVGEFKDFGLHDVLRSVIHAAGKSTGHKVTNETIRTVFECDRMLRAGGFSAVSLPGLLGNVANKTMLAAYEAVATTWQLFCAVEANSDFKQHERYRLTGKGEFTPIGPDGELKHVGLTEEKYTSQLDTFGAIIALTRQMMINDDLGAFTALPRLIGRMAAIKLEKAVYTLLLSNPGDFFHSDNNNLLTGAGSVLALAGLDAADALFLLQTDDNGDPIMATPSTLIVPTTLKNTAKALLNSIELRNPAGDGPEPTGNPHHQSFKLGVSPWLNGDHISGASDTHWYLFAEPNDLAAMEVAFLNGQRSPVIESGDTDFNTLGVQWRGYHDFGVAMRDRRMAVRSAGA